MGGGVWIRVSTCLALVAACDTPANPCSPGFRSSVPAVVTVAQWLGPLGMTGPGLALDRQGHPRALLRRRGSDPGGG